jgi:hypothetical protein
MRTLRAVLTAAALTVAAVSTVFAAEPGVIVSTPELTVLRHGGNESVALPAGAYRDFEVEGERASFVLEDSAIPAGSRELRGGGIKSIAWTPGEDGTRVELTFARPPQSSLINALPGTETRPQVPQVIAGFNFAEPARSAPRPAAGRQRAAAEGESNSPYGDYELPEFPRAHYSDALITLNVRNVDFREVLWLMSEIGNVSIMLDPYWADEPTGGRRPPGAGADPGVGSGGDAGPGFKPGGEFSPTAPVEGGGNLTMNLVGVPFDMALDLILQSVGLVKVDVYPGTLR